MLEDTLVLIKPDGVARGLSGEIIRRFEQRGFKIVGLKMVTLARELAEINYGEHRGKPFFTNLVDYITSGPLVAMVIRGENAVKFIRIMMGLTNPLDAAPGTIRGDFAINIQHNVVHGSDSVASAEREIGVFFTQNEIMH